MTRVIVTAVPERTPTVEYLQHHIPNLEICWDEKRSLIDTFLRACQMAGYDPVIRLQDDIILTKDFVAKVEKVIADRPDDVIQFFSMRKDDLTVGSRYCLGSTYLMNQCFYLPAGVSKDIIEFFWSPAWAPYFEAHPDTEDDSMMREMFRVQRRKYFLHVPSLVDHQRSRSIVSPKRSSARVSLTFQEPEYEHFPNPPSNH